MTHHQLGTSDLRVSAIAFGCMSLGPDHAANAALLHRALDGGINFFDTADLYQHGENEVTVGRAFRGRRAQVLLASKVGNQWRPDGSGWDWNPTKAYILQAADASLRRLQTDYLDLYQLHGGTLEDPTDETIEAFEQLREQGKIRYYGISSIRSNVIRRWAESSNLVSVMMQYNLLDRRPDESCLELLRGQNIGVLARGAYAQGLLAGKEAKPYLGHSAETVARAAAAVRVASGEQPGSAAVRFVLQQPGITGAVLGIRTEAQLDAALAVAQMAKLTDAQLRQLRDSAPALVYEQHR